MIFIDWNNILHGNTTDYYYYIRLKTLKLTQEHHSVILHTHISLSSQNEHHR